MCVLYTCSVYAYIIVYIYETHTSHFQSAVPSTCFMTRCVRDAQWKCIFRGYKETSQGWVCVLFSCLGFKRIFFLQQKGSFWFPWLCGCWFVFMVSSRCFLTNKFTFHVPTYTHAFCRLSVCNTHLECFSSWNILSNVCKSGQYRRGFFLSYDIKKAKLSGIAEVPFTDSPFYR